MQNIRNFKLVKPSKKMLRAYTNPVTGEGKNTLFLRSESGDDWYECQKSFADDTIKVMYDANGVVLSIVDKPVPERGNILAVSMFWPEGMSVAEITALPDGFSLDDTWIYVDGEIIRSQPAVIARNKRILRKKLSVAAGFMFMYQQSSPQEGDDDCNAALREYATNLRNVDLAAPDWPPVPDFML